MMRRFVLLLIILFFLAGCDGQQGVIVVTTTPAAMTDMPTNPPPSTQEWRNANPDLTLGKCILRRFETEQWGWEFVTQCNPAGYTLYEIIPAGSSPIRSVHTGAAYSILPNGSGGSIGYTLPAMQLLPGCYAAHMDGDVDMWGVQEHYTIGAFWTMEGVPGAVDMGKHPLSANGAYLATFYVNAPQLSDYTITIYLHLQYASATAESYFTVENITVEEVSTGHCE